MEENLEKSMNDTRKYYEASITGLANLFKTTPLSLRSDIKDDLIKRKIIKESTTELSQDVLDMLATKISKYAWHMSNNVPPWERPEKIDLPNLFNR